MSLDLFLVIFLFIFDVLLVIDQVIFIVQFIRKWRNR